MWGEGYRQMCGVRSTDGSEEWRSTGVWREEYRCVGCGVGV